MKNVRIGTVTVVNKPERKVRVHFPDDNIVSGWLKVLKNPPFIPAKDVPQRTEYAGGGSGESAYEAHCHTVVIEPWLPNVNETVLCLYDDSFNCDGYVIGAL